MGKKAQEGEEKKLEKSPESGTDTWSGSAGSHTEEQGEQEEERVGGSEFICSIFKLFEIMEFEINTPVASSDSKKKKRLST